MKLSYSRRYRRTSAKAKENAMFKKDSQHERSFFASPSNESFFKPNVAINRKCDHCEANDKNISRMSDGKDEEKKVNKMDDKKEDKEIHKKEEEKEVHKMDDKKEDKEIHKKEEDKEVYKMSDQKDDKEIHKKDEEKEVHKMSEEKEEKKISKKGTATESSTAKAGAYIQSLNGKGNALPDKAKQFFNQRIGYDFSAVKIHTSTEAELSARQLNAKAYAVDHNIVFNKGQYNPGTAEGDRLLAHELAHVVQNKKAQKIDRKQQHPEKEKETSISITGKKENAKNKVAHGSCEGVEVHGQTDANYTNKFTSTAKAKPSDACEDCVAPDCITAKGTVTSVFKAKPVVSLPTVPSGLTPCETKAVGKFINTTLRKHEQQHVTAFKSYNGTVKTPYAYEGCKSGLQDYTQSIHDNIESQRSSDSNAKSDALDPFVKPIPCNCE